MATDKDAAEKALAEALQPVLADFLERSPTTVNLLPIFEGKDGWIEFEITGRMRRVPGRAVQVEDARYIMSNHLDDGDDDLDP